MDEKKVTFLASFPPIMSAIKVDGSGGMRIQFDIPESEMGEAVKLMLYRQVPLKVTVEPYEDTLKNRAGQGNGKKQHELQEGTERKSEWRSTKKPRINSDT